MGYAFTARSGSILHVEDSGSGSPVLCLHGIGGGAFFFAGFRKRLAETHRVLAIDLPGSGRSTSSPADFTFESWIDDIGDLVASLNEPVTIVGHSLGTLLSLRAWASWPERIRALVFACGLPKARPNIHERLSQRAELIAREGVNGWGPKVVPGVFSRRSQDARPEITGLFEQLFELQRGPEYVRQIELLLAADENAVVPTVTVPCAAIAGREDSYAPPEAVEAFVAALPRPCPVEVLEDAAHMAFLEQPEAFADAVRRFLETLPPPSPAS